MPQTSQQDPSIESLTPAQRERLAFIELRLRFMGNIRRQDLMTRFGTQEAAATRDIGLYRTLAADNIQYNAKTHLIGDRFSPLFFYNTKRVLAWFPHCIGDNAEPQPKTWIISVSPALLDKPDLNILSAIIRHCRLLGAFMIDVYRDASAGARSNSPRHKLLQAVRHIQNKPALVGYAQSGWSIDYSEAHSLLGPEYRLWLRNCTVPKGVDSPPIAKGYPSENSIHG